MNSEQTKNETTEAEEELSETEIDRATGGYEGRTTVSGGILNVTTDRPPTGTVSF